MLLWLIIFFLVIAVFMFVHKLIFKSEMQKKLGRKVEDRELTSISAWMDDKPPVDQSKPRR